MLRGTMGTAVTWPEDLHPQIVYVEMLCTRLDSVKMEAHTREKGLAGYLATGSIPWVLAPQWDEPDCICIRLVYRVAFK